MRNKELMRVYQETAKIIAANPKPLPNYNNADTSELLALSRFYGARDTSGHYTAISTVLESRGHLRSKIQISQFHCTRD